MSQLALFFAVKMPEIQASDAFEMRAVHLLEQIVSCGGQPQMEAPPVAWVSFALDQLPLFETVDEARYPTEGEQGSLCKRVQPHRAVRCPGEPEQDLVLADSQVMSTLHLPVELPDQSGVSAKKAAPGLEFGGLQAVGIDNWLLAQVNSP